jgi:beta-lactamase class A
LAPPEPEHRAQRHKAQGGTEIRKIRADYLLVVLALAVIACSRNKPAAVSPPSLSLTTNASSSERSKAADAALTQRFKTLSESADGDIGVAVVHVESGRMADFEGMKELPLYSVYKLPLAVTVLQEVEKKNLSLEKKVRVTLDDVAPGSQFNTDLWRQPVEKPLQSCWNFRLCAATTPRAISCCN